MAQETLLIYSGDKGGIPVDVQHILGDRLTGLYLDDLSQSSAFLPVADVDLELALNVVRGQWGELVINIRRMDDDKMSSRINCKLGAYSNRVEEWARAVNKIMRRAFNYYAHFGEFGTAGSLWVYQEPINSIPQGWLTMPRARAGL